MKSYRNAVLNPLKYFTSLHTQQLKKKCAPRAA